LLPVQIKTIFNTIDFINMSTETKVEKPKKEKPANLVIPPPKPKLSKAERRALQEQQRAAKSALQQGNQGGGKPPTNEQKSSATSTPKQPQQQPPNQPADTPKTATTRSTAGGLVSHLKAHQDPELLFETGATLRASIGADTTQLHPAVVERGYRFSTGQIRGGNARCRAMLETFAAILPDYVNASNSTDEDFRQTIDQMILKPAFTYWTEHCRPHSVSMGNAFTFLKTAVASLDRDLDAMACVDKLQESIHAYERERIEYAMAAIADLTCQKLLRDRDEVLLVYGHSEVITKILQGAVSACRQLRVILVDSRPLLEGKKQLEKIRELGIPCTYILLNAMTYVFQDVTKVLLGTAAMMSDGSVMGRVGTASVAMVAAAHNIPVLVCGETYKISNRVQLESITNNELGDPNLVSTDGDTTNSKRLNLLYDLTPASFVSGIVTELGIVPPTSIAVLLREMNPQEK
jgi:translation initiation factor eIF-2B subunit delta